MERVSAFVPPRFWPERHVYAGSPLARAADRRGDLAFLEAAREAPETLFAPLWGLRHGWRRKGEAVEVLFERGELPAPPAAEGVSFLGLLEERAVFALDLGEGEVPPLPWQSERFADLRTLSPDLPAPAAAILAHARGLVYWQRRHRFCGVCGGRLETREAGYIRHCPACHTDHFPRTDPAVIMLVIRGTRALLAHSPRFPVPDMYSTLAGFVEPGESLEEAVVREVEEETGIRVRGVHYHSSQPWPFPASLMVGFYAEAETEALRLDPAELSDARWFSREEIRDPLRLGIKLPRRDSIARRLIEDWLAGG
jgi:NAD+ diphosphatase